MAEEQNIHLGVALDGTGWHPAAWREEQARPEEILSAGYWVDLVQRADAAQVDFVTIEDSLRIQSDQPFEADGRTDRVRGRLDAVLIANRVAPVTSGIGLIPSVQVTYTEPFHISKAIATLDYVSQGRAGVRVQISARPDEAALFGRRELPALDPTRRDDPEVAALIDDLFDEAEDYVEVTRRLWDSWEDDAEIRDTATGRFIDREKLHYIDFSGRWFSVRGPSITPRPPQGQPRVAALGHAQRPYELIARATDLGFITPHDREQAASISGRVVEAGRRAGRERDVAILSDLVVYLDSSNARAAALKDRLDERAGDVHRSDAAQFVGTPAGLADLIEDWASAGLAGFRLRPATLPHDLTQITDVLVPELQRRRRFRLGYESPTLRGLFGLHRPASRYATV